MSLFFCPTDSFIPARDGPLNPALSVWLKSSLVSFGSVLPCIPLLRGWAAYVSQREYLRLSHGVVSPNSSELLYKGAIDAMLQLKRKHGFFTFFRGSLPLLAGVSVGVSTKISSALVLTYMMGSKDTNHPAMLSATVFALLTVSEAVLQPFKYLYFRKIGDHIFQKNESIATINNPGSNLPKTSITNTHHLQFQSAKQIMMNTLNLYGIRGIYAGFTPALFSSAVIAASPVIIQSLPFSKQEQIYPVQIALNTIAYLGCLVSFRMIMATSSSNSQTPCYRYSGISEALKVHFKSGYRGFLTGILAMSVVQASAAVTSLYLASKSYIIPF